MPIKKPEVVRNLIRYTKINYEEIKIKAELTEPQPKIVNAFVWIVSAVMTPTVYRDMKSILPPE